MKRVAVTGLGIVAPGGNDPDEFFANLCAGRSAIARLPDSRSARLETRVVAPAQLDATRHFPAPRLRMLDRVSHLALVAAKQAVANARLLFSEEERATSGVFFGTGMGGAASTDEGYASLYQERSDRVKPYSVLLAMNNAPGAWIGMSTP